MAEEPGAGEFRGVIRGTVLTTKVCACAFDEAVQALAELVQQRRGGYVCPANAYSVTLAQADEAYQSILNDADLVTADGMPIVWMLRRTGHAAERVHNDDLFFACCRTFPHWRHFFVGGRLNQPLAIELELQRRFPGIKIVGSHATPQRPVPDTETEAILAELTQSQPSIIWVGMGTPAQDWWMNSVRARVTAPMVGVGSLFDLLTGHTRAAPAWMKRSGLQWLFRLAQEPRRLGVRYVWYNSLFVLGASRQLLLDRRSPLA